jgi:activator of 2-hydroxyglutaryl-CoA dehydratase
MLTMGLDVGSRSAQCVILEDGQLLTYGNVETGPQSARTAYVAVDAAVHRRCELWGENRMKMPDVKTDHLRIEDMDYIVSTGYGRAVSTVLDMGGQDCKAMRVNERGQVTRFAINDKCAAGTGRFVEIIAEAMKVPLFEVGELSLKSTKEIIFSAVCTIFVKSEAVALMKKGVSRADILAGLHEAISRRVLTLLKRVGVEDKFVITGGIARNVGVVTRIGKQLGGIEINIPAEPQIAGALGAALFAFDRAGKKARHPDAGEKVTRLENSHA